LAERPRGVALPFFWNTFDRYVQFEFARGTVRFEAGVPRRESESAVVPNDLLEGGFDLAAEALQVASIVEFDRHFWLLSGVLVSGCAPRWGCAALEVCTNARRESS